MNAIQQTARAEVERTLDREIELLMSAVNLVASRRAPSATVAGLRLAEAAMDVVRPLAIERGLTIVALWGADERACDVRVRRPAPE